MSDDNSAVDVMTKFQVKRALNAALGAREENITLSKTDGGVDITIKGVSADKAERVVLAFDVATGAGAYNPRTPHELNGDSLTIHYKGSEQALKDIDVEAMQSVAGGKKSQQGLG